MIRKEVIRNLKTIRVPAYELFCQSMKGPDHVNQRIFRNEKESGKCAAGG